MVMIVSFDLTGIMCLIIIPPIVLYLSKLAWELAHATRTLINNRYLARIIKENNEVWRENIRLQNEIVETHEKK